MSIASDLTIKLAQQRQERAQSKSVGLSAANAAVARAQERASGKISRSSRQATRSVVPAADLASNMLVGRDTLQTPGAGNEATVVQQIISSGGVFTQFTYCDSGTPATAWWPIWATNPT